MTHCLLALIAATLLFGAAFVLRVFAFVIDAAIFLIVLAAIAFACGALPI